jgi:glycosyltransferase involved in cell wall biosynthesis
LPSRSEGFSNAIVEAMASSLPVVATRVGGNEEAIVDGVSGYLVPAEDVDALATAIERLLCDPLEARRMGAAGREIVTQKFTADAMMKAITHRYGVLLAGG